MRLWLAIIYCTPFPCYSNEYHRTMTTKVLNRPWFDQLSNQYREDVNDNIAYPLTYILWSKHFGRDICYEIKQKVAPAEFERAIRDYSRYVPREHPRDQPLSYENDVLKVFFARRPGLERFDSDLKLEVEEGANM